MRQSVVQHAPRRHAVDKDDQDEDDQRQLGSARKREGTQAEAEQGQGRHRREPECTAAAYVKPANEDAAKAEPYVGRDQDRPCSCGSGAADGEHEDWRVEEHAPAGRHEARLREAREEDAPGGEHLDRYHWVCCEIVLHYQEEDESDERQNEREGLNLVCETVEEEDNGCGLELTCVSPRATCNSLNEELTNSIAPM